MSTEAVDGDDYNADYNGDYNDDYNDDYDDDIDYNHYHEYNIDASSSSKFPL